MCSRAGGFVSHFGTSDADKVHRMVEAGDRKAVLVWNAMIYQICKEIGAMSTVLCGKVDGILLTGGLVRFDDIVEGIRSRCGWIATITSIPEKWSRRKWQAPYCGFCAERKMRIPIPENRCGKASISKASPHKTNFAKIG
jgi:butyrate kinase